MQNNRSFKSFNFKPPSPNLEKVVAMNKELSGEIVNIMGSKFLQIKVDKFATLDSFPDTQLAILSYKIDQDLRTRFPQKSMLKLGTLVKVSATSMRRTFECDEKSLRLAEAEGNVAEDPEWTTGFNDGGAGDKNTEKKSAKRSKSVERHLANILAKVVVITEFGMILSIKIKDRYKGYQFEEMRLKNEDEVEVVYTGSESHDKESMTVLDIKKNLKPKEDTKICAKQSNGKWTATKIWINKRKEEVKEANDLINLSPSTENDFFTEDDTINYNQLRQETADLLSEISEIGNEDKEMENAKEKNKSFQEDPKIAASNLARSPLVTLEEVDQATVQSIGDLVDIKADIICETAEAEQEMDVTEQSDEPEPAPPLLEQAESAPIENQLIEEEPSKSKDVIEVNNNDEEKEEIAEVDNVVEEKAAVEEKVLDEKMETDKDRAQTKKFEFTEDELKELVKNVAKIAMKTAMEDETFYDRIVEVQMQEFA